MLQTIDPAILYFGTPVVLISTLNEDGSPNLAPMSSAWWLGRRCLLGLGARSKTPQNIIRTGECVLNLPSEHLASMVDRLALTTGSHPVPQHKLEKGYRHEKDKFGISGFTIGPSETVTPPRALECPVQLEARLAQVHPLEEENEQRRGSLVALEVQITRVHVDSSIQMEGSPNRIDPDKWRPLIMSFQQFYGLSPRLQPSTLATIPEEMYRIKTSMAQVR
ncbi:MAG TPA: flavin reductase family protein [Alloacidobacterium sp.]|nr:flavin reductase family protein [Alloacidobacterium sp.]